jgi:hypothetical protein
MFIISIVVPSILSYISYKNWDTANMDKRLSLLLLALFIIVIFIMFIGITVVLYSTGIFSGCGRFI